MLKSIISPSMMCVDYSKLTETLRIFEASGEVGYLHIDIMDGEFVPNYTLGTDFCRQLRMMTSIPLDIHLMVNNPERKLAWFEPHPKEIISVHYESTKAMKKTLEIIRSFGAKAFIALNPSTPIEVLSNFLGDFDGVMIMTVPPGFAGQNMVKYSYEKIYKTRCFLDSLGYLCIDIEVDGQVGFEKGLSMRRNGANIFASGTSGVFNKDHSISKNISILSAISKNISILSAMLK